MPLNPTVIELNVTTVVEPGFLKRAITRTIRAPLPVELDQTVRAVKLLILQMRFQLFL
jgi:hypothetical protein